MHQRLVAGPAILAALVASLACAPKNPNELPGGSPNGVSVLVVHGVVTDTAAKQPMSNVSVTLYSADNVPAAKTDASGYFQFRNIAQANNLLIQFSKAGYKTRSFKVDVRSCGGCGDAGYSISDSIDASTTMDLDLNLAIAGWVWAGTAAAAGAQVVLYQHDVSCATGGIYYATTMADSAGHFLFAAVQPGFYTIRVWPYDKGNTGVASYRLYNRCLGKIDAEMVSPSNNLTNLSLVLEDETGVIVGTSFQNLTTDFEAGFGFDGYPLTTAALTSTPPSPSTTLIGGVACSVCGVGGTLIGANAPIWLHFGSTVDPNSAVFELVDMDLGNGSTTASFSTPMKIGTSWDHGVIATITVDPSNPLLQTADPHRRYQLRIKSLQFTDSTFLIDPRNQNPGRITFDYVTTPVYLANPTPTFFIDDFINYTSANAKQVASRVVVDADTLWALDLNNDFVYGYSPGAQKSGGVRAGQGIKLKWSHVPGAVSYKMYARNTTTNGNIGDNKRLWRQVNGQVQFMVDPNGQTTIVASSVMGYTAITGPMLATFNDFGAVWVIPPTLGCFMGPSGVGSCGGSLNYPFLFGNPIQVAVTSVDKDGYETPIDPTKTLVLQDSFGPLVQSSSPGFGGSLSSDFRGFTMSSLKGNVTQRGQLFRKIVTIPWSEPLLTTTAPVLTAKSGQVKIVQQQNAVWDPFNNVDQPTNISDFTAVPVVLSVPGGCTEVMVARTGVPAGVNPMRGDTIIPVRNATLFTVGASTRTVFINASGVGGGTWIDEITGIAAVDTVNNRVTLAQGLQNSVAAGNLMCLVDGPANAVQNFISAGGATGADISVNNASIFFQGEIVAFYLPQTGGNPNQLLQTRTIIGLDTVSSPNKIIVSSSVSPLHNTTTVIFPFPAGSRYGVGAGGLEGEYALRPQTDMSTNLKLDVTSGAGVTITLNTPAANLSVGDVVVFDVDGDLNQTFVDQYFATVKAIQFLPTATTPSYTFVVDLLPPAVPAGTVFIHGQSKVIALGDAFTVTGVQDTSGTATNPHTVNIHQDTFTADGSIY
jgi:hypothetical protein